jgi:hypothetical protein
VEQIMAFTRAGGGVGVFFNAPEQLAPVVPVNRLLLQFHLAYTFFLLDEGAEPPAPIPVPESYAQIRDVNLIPLLARFKATVKQSCVDDQALEDVVTSLRFYIAVCDDSHCEELEQVSDYCWDFLRRTEYSTPEGVCPEISQGLAALMLYDLSLKLPPSKVVPFPEHAVFPGKSDESPPGPPELPIQMALEAWMHTGLWLPAGAIGVIDCDQAHPDIHVQIGAHHNSLLEQPGPWRRWPLVITLRGLTTPHVEIASPFGGIVYLVALAEEPPEPFTIHLQGFVKYPLKDASDPAVWEDTKDCEVPWGEIVAGGVIFTLPTEEVKRLDVDVIHAKFSVIVGEIRKYVGEVPAQPFRIVFDVALPASGSERYPLVFLLDDIEGILNTFGEPTPELFKAVMLMVAGAIREGSLDDQTGTAIAAVATGVVFQKLFNGFDPLDFEGIPRPTLFNELWEIQKKDPKVIPATIGRTRDESWPTWGVQDDMWIAFVRELCKIGKKDFTKLLERAWPIPLNISQSLQGLPAFVSK